MFKKLYTYYVLFRLYIIYGLWPDKIQFEDLPAETSGRTMIDMASGSATIIIASGLNNLKEVFLSVAHEYRHMWQYHVLPADDYIQWSYIAEKTHLASAIEVDAEVFALRFYRGAEIQGLEIFEDMKACISDFQALQECGMKWLLRDMILSL